MPSRYTALFQRLLDVCTTAATTYRHWNDVVCLLGVESVALSKTGYSQFYFVIWWLFQAQPIFFDTWSSYFSSLQSSFDAKWPLSLYKLAILYFHFFSIFIGWYTANCVSDFNFCFLIIKSVTTSFIQKQPSIGDLIKKCSEIIQ